MDLMYSREPESLCASPLKAQVHPPRLIRKLSSWTPKHFRVLPQQIELN